MPLAASGFAGASPEIVLSPDASPSEHWAADQLRLHLAQMLPPNAPGAPRVIAIGQSKTTERLALSIPDGEACLLKHSGDTLVIAGGRARGTMYGVFSLLERLGCRWYTSDVARIPALTRFRRRNPGEVVRPAFSYREIFFTEAQGRDWSAHNRLNGNFHQLDDAVGGKISYQPWAHSFYDLVPPAIYFDSHPEYFAFVAGKRRPANAQLCLTNPDIVAIARQRVRQWLDRRPAPDVVSISQNDGGGWCECSPCRAVVNAEGGALSGLLLRFVNQVAEPFARSHPALLIDTLAYQRTADPPLLTRPAPNVQVRFCPIDACQAHSFESPGCPFNRPFHDRLDAWSRIAPRLILWQYSINFAHFLLPFPNESAQMADFPRLRRAGVSGVFVEGAVSNGGGADDAELRSFLAARLLWNPDADIETETRGFMRAVYGEAAAPMLAYHDLRRRETARGAHLWIDQNVDAPYLSTRFLDDARFGLTQARARAASDPVKRRIDRALLGFDYISMMRARRCTLRANTCGPPDPARTRLDIRHFIDRAQSLGITHLREGYPIAQQARDLDLLTAAFPVIALSTTAATAIIAPDLGARVIRFNDALRIPDPGEFAYPRAGGLWPAIAPTYTDPPEPAEWRTNTGSENSAHLTGVSQRGVELDIEFRLEGPALHARLTAANPGRDPRPVTLRFQTELAAGPATRTDQDGSLVLTGDNIPNGTFAAGGITHEFDPRETGRYVVRWSSRATPLTILILATPEVTLNPGESLTLTSTWHSVL